MSNRKELLEEAGVQEDCFGRYYSSESAECKICLDAPECIKLCGHVITTNIGGSMAKEKLSFTISDIENHLKSLQLQNSVELKKGNTVRISGKNKNCVDLVFNTAQTDVKVFSMYDVAGKLSNCGKKDSRPFRVKTNSLDDIKFIVEEVLKIDNQ